MQERPPAEDLSRKSRSECHWNRGGPWGRISKGEGPGLEPCTWGGESLSWRPPCVKESEGAKGLKRTSFKRGEPQGLVSGVVARGSHLVCG